MYNYGIDLLKIVSMLFIISIHVLGHGGVLETSQGGGYALSWLIEIVGFCGVNCYAIISGFVSYREYDRTWKWENYISLWIKTVTYGVIITLVFYFISPNTTGLIDIVQTLMPVTFNQYWYFTAYSVLFLIMPFLDRLIRSVNWKKLLVFIAILSCYATVASYFTDVFELNGGYSFVWLACLYIVGAIIRKEELYKRCKKKCIMLILLFLIFITWIWKVWIGGLHEGLGNVPISYIAPNILGIAICFVLIFSSINIHSKWVKKIAASTFGIYLFHDQRIFRKHVIIARFKFIADMPIWSIPVMVIAISSILFLIGLLVDKIWSIFYKRLKIERMFG